MKIVDFNRIIGYFNSRGYYSERSRVYVDWKMLNIFFVVVLILFLLADGYVWEKYKDVLAEEIKIEESEIVAVNKNALNEAIDVISKKETRFQNGLKDFSLTDPSL